jgi:hypothetical protein
MPPRPLPQPLPRRGDRWRLTAPSSPSQPPLLPRSREPLPPRSHGDSRPRHLHRSPLPSVTGIAGRVTEPSPPSRESAGVSLGSPVASNSYLKSAARDHGGRVSASSSTSPTLIASIAVGKLRRTNDLTYQNNSNAMFF